MQCVHSALKPRKLFRGLPHLAGGGGKKIPSSITRERDDGKWEVVGLKCLDKPEK